VRPTGIIKRELHLCFLTEHGWRSTTHGLGDGVQFPPDSPQRRARWKWGDYLVEQAENVLKVWVTWEIFRVGTNYDIDVYLKHEIFYQEARLETEIEARLEHHFRTLDDIPF